jgi:hypothetical protein
MAGQGLLAGGSFVSKVAIAPDWCSWSLKEHFDRRYATTRSTAKGTRKEWLGWEIELCAIRALKR